jgi:hypothetical protein
VELLEPVEQLLRISMSLRGERPSISEIARVRDDPAQLDVFVDAWLQSDAFGRQIRDLHAQDFLTRTDTLEQLPSRGPIRDDNTWQVHTSVPEAPMRLVEWVVMSDLPYTEIVQTEVMIADRITAEVNGLAWDPRGPTEWQETSWEDGRPKAGLLSSSQLWRRHRSAGSNFHRLRANFIADTFLCEPFSERDIVVEGGIDLSDELAVADAVMTNDACVGCHQALDPLAAHFWGFRKQLKNRAVRLAYEDDCRWDPESEIVRGQGHGVEDNCYPLRFYYPIKEHEWQDWELRPPSFYGQPSARMDTLGEQIASDQRFAECTARRFWGWFAQEPKDEVDDALAFELADDFKRSGYDAKALVRQIVTHERFLAERADSRDWEPVGLLQVRPEQLDSVLTQLMDFTWWGSPTSDSCDPTCWGRVNLLRSDLYGYRVMMGGVDSIQVTSPTHTPIPTLPLVLERAASEAAGVKVEADLGLPADQRRLLSLVEDTTVDEPTVRAQLVELHARILTEPLEATAPEIDRSFALWTGVYELTGDPIRAWELTIATLLQDPRMLFF